MPQPTPEGQQFIFMLHDLQTILTQRRRIRLILRACWITVLTIAAGLAARTWTDLDLSYVQIAILAGIVLLIGIVYAAMPSYELEQMSQIIDDSFGLDARLTTALELNQNGERTGWSQPLTDQARQVMTQVRPRVLARTNEPLMLEAQTLLIATGLCFAMLVLNGLAAPLPQATSSEIPALPQPQAELQPPSQLQPEDEPVTAQDQGVGERPARGSGESALEGDPEGQAAADALSDALRDNGATRAAADALDQGDTAGASEAIRSLADQADQLSPQAREQIADSLEQAADDLQQSQPERAAQLRDQAQQIREGGSGTVQGLEQLARTIDELGEPSNSPQLGGNEPADPGAGEAAGASEGQDGSSDSPEGAGTGGGSGSQTARDSRSSPPAAIPGQDVVPLPPAAEDPTGPTTSGGNQGSTSITLPGGEGSGGGGSTNSGTVPDDISDPAIIPPELRDAIQDYFEH